jgi:hypothetical protein
MNTQSTHPGLEKRETWGTRKPCTGCPTSRAFRDMGFSIKSISQLRWVFIRRQALQADAANAKLRGSVRIRPRAHIPWDETGSPDVPPPRAPAE